MRIESGNQLAEYRKKLLVNRAKRVEHGMDVRLFGVFIDLREHQPVIIFNLLTKRFITSESGKKYGHGQIRENIFALFTTENEAWRFYYSKLVEMRKMVEEHMKTIVKAEEMIKFKIKDHPEHFI